MFLHITFAWWRTCDKHLICFGPLVVEIKDCAIASDEEVTNTRGIEVIQLCLGLPSLSGFWDVSHKRPYAVAIDELVGSMFAVLVKCQEVEPRG